MDFSYSDEQKLLRMLKSKSLLPPILLMACLGFWACSDSRPKDATRDRAMEAEEAELADLPHAHVFREGDKPYKRRPLNDPEWLTAENAAHMRPDDPILGFYLENKAWAVPLWIIRLPHVANLTLDGKPVLITFCTMCSSGNAFDPVLNGKRHTFRLAGFYNGSIIISDFETGSIWSPYTTEALHGPLKGSKLERLPLYQCTWADWLALHPASLVVYGAQKLRGKVDDATLVGAPGFKEPVKNSLLRPLDERLPHNELILGVEINGQARAYPLAVLDKIGSVLNDTLGQKEIVVFHKPGTWLAIVFSRQVGDEVLVFAPTKDGGIVDRKYGGGGAMPGKPMAAFLPVASFLLFPLGSRNGISGLRIIRRPKSSALTAFKQSVAI